MSPDDRDTFAAAGDRLQQEQAERVADAITLRIDEALAQSMLDDALASAIAPERKNGRPRP